MRDSPGFDQFSVANLDLAAALTPLCVASKTEGYSGFWGRPLNEGAQLERNELYHWKALISLSLDLTFNLR